MSYFIAEMIHAADNTATIHTSPNFLHVVKYFFGLESIVDYRTVGKCARRNFCKKSNFQPKK